MKAFADGWERQRGNVFSFGNHEETELTLSGMDQEKLKTAPINNLDAKRSVGSVNYELKIGGAKNLKTVSSSHVIGKSLALTEGKVMDKKFREMERARIFPAIVAAWDQKQDMLSKEGLGLKEQQNIVVDQRRNSDLIKLKEKGGPFGTSEEVKLFVSSDIETAEKVERLYLEVRYARDSCVSFPKNSEIFRLKKAYRKLEVKTYADNLIIFLDKVSYRNNVKMSDFESALLEL